MKFTVAPATAPLEPSRTRTTMGAGSGCPAAPVWPPPLTSMSWTPGVRASESGEPVSEPVGPPPSPPQEAVSASRQAPRTRAWRRLVRIRETLAGGAKRGAPLAPGEGAAVRAVSEQFAHPVFDSQPAWKCVGTKRDHGLHAVAPIQLFSGSAAVLSFPFAAPRETRRCRRRASCRTDTGARTLAG